ncbi:MAG: hypothetical protein R2758_00895 [Bacteroidales bacterium]
MPISAQDKTGYQLLRKPSFHSLTPGRPRRCASAPDNQTMLLLYRPGLPSIADLSQPELRLAGIRFDLCHQRPEPRTVSKQDHCHED